MERVAANAARRGVMDAYGARRCEGGKHGGGEEAQALSLDVQRWLVGREGGRLNAFKSACGGRGWGRGGSAWRWAELLIGP